MGFQLHSRPHTTGFVAFKFIVLLLWYVVDDIKRFEMWSVRLPLSVVSGENGQKKSTAPASVERSDYMAAIMPFNSQFTGYSRKLRFRDDLSTFNATHTMLVFLARALCFSLLLLGHCSAVVCLIRGINCTIWLFAMWMDYVWIHLHSGGRRGIAINIYGFLSS